MQNFCTFFCNLKLFLECPYLFHIFYFSAHLQYNSTSRKSSSFLGSSLDESNILGLSLLCKTVNNILFQMMAELLLMNCHCQLEKKRNILLGI